MTRNQSQAYFVAGLRTPFGRSFKGAYAEVRPDDLVIELIQGHRTRFADLWVKDPDEFILGCAYPEGEQGYNMARPVSLGSGLGIPAMTVNRLCASSLDATVLAAAKVSSGMADRILVGGVESMSRIPRRGANFSESERVKQSCPHAYVPNGDTAENVAARYQNITRQQQEDFSARSHELADAAYAAGHYDSSILPFKINKDEFIRVPVDRAKMASLAPAFCETGVVTAATSSPLTDGATLGWILGDAELQRYKHTNPDAPVLQILDSAVGHVAPEIMGLGPVPATQLLLRRNGFVANDIAAWEINEAFAIQVLASLQELQIDLDRVNIWGGALALGHPLGASGLRLLITLLSRLAQAETPGSLGVATLCVGGGQGVSVLTRCL
jgi:acetyl-CoA acyltransferase